MTSFIRNKTFISSLILIAIIVISSLFMLHLHKNEPAHKKEASIDAFVINGTYNQFNEQGLLHSHLFSPKMLHLQKHNSAIFSQPRMLLYSDERVPWYIRAKHAKTYDGEDKVFLWDDVNLHQPAYLEHPETTIKSQTSTVYPKKSLATGKQFVTITRPGTTIKGKGYKANLKIGQYTLLSQSHGVYKATTPEVEQHDKKTTPSTHSTY